MGDIRDISWRRIVKIMILLLQIYTVRALANNEACSVKSGCSSEETHHQLCPCWSLMLRVAG